MKLSDLDKELFKINTSKIPDRGLDRISKIGLSVVFLFVVGILLWRFTGISLLNLIAAALGLIISFIEAIFNFVSSWKVMLLLILLFIAIMLLNIRSILINILNKLLNDRL
jgi:hypothetical protein